MKLITIRSQIREVADAWRRQYGHGVWLKDAKKQDILRRLDMVNKETATPELIASIIGNDSWARPSKCHECGGEFDAVIQVGEEPDYESNTACLCIDCITRAASLIKGPPTAVILGDQ